MKKKRRRIKPLEYTNPVCLYKDILKGEVKTFPSGYFLYDTDRSASKEIVRFFLEEYLGYRTRQDILMKVRLDDFRKNKLGGLINLVYQTSPSRAAMDAFPEYKMLPWEFHECHNSYWKGEAGITRAIEAFHEVFHNRMGISSKEDIKPYMNHESITELGLHGAFKRGFNSSLYTCAEFCFPGMFQPWELGSHVDNGFWTEEKGIKALKWLLEEELNLTRDEIPHTLNRELLKKYDLYGMIQRCFNGNKETAIDKTYPGVYKPWELPRTEVNYWNKETVKEALDWLIYDKLKITPIEAMNLRQKDTYPYGLYGLIRYEKIPFRAIVKKYYSKEIIDITQLKVE